MTMFSSRTFYASVSDALARQVAAVGHLATAAFCLVILALSLRSVSEHYTLWSSTDHAAGNLSGAAAVVLEVVIVVVVVIVVEAVIVIVIVAEVAEVVIVMVIKIYLFHKII